MEGTYFRNRHSNETLDSSLRNLVGKFYPQINLYIIFQSKNSIGSFLNFKDKIPQCVRSNVVYKFSCLHCKATFVGESPRHFHTRISEQRGITTVFIFSTMIFLTSLWLVVVRDRLRQLFPANN